MDPERLDTLLSETARLMRSQLRIEGESLAVLARRAGRRLPRAERRAARRLARAEAMMGHPKLARQLDAARLEADHARLVAHLRARDPRQERVTRLLGTAGALSFNLLLLFALLVALLVWRGLA